MKRRQILAASLSALAMPVFAQSKPSGVIAINDGVSYKSNANESDDRYAALIRDINKTTGLKLRIERVPSYAALAAGLQNGAYDMAFVHPAHHAIGAMKGGQYHLAALSKAHLNYKANFLVRKDSPIKTAADLAGKVIYTPDVDSITAWLARATVAENFPDRAARPKFMPLKFQDAVKFAVENKMGDAGATASSAEVKEWLDGGHRVLMTSRSIPIKQFLVHARYKPQLDAVQATLLAQNDTGKISVPEGFVGFEEAILLKAGEWLAQGSA